MTESAKQSSSLASRLNRLDRFMRSQREKFELVGDYDEAKVFMTGVIKANFYLDEMLFALKEGRETKGINLAYHYYLGIELNGLRTGWESNMPEAMLRGVYNMLNGKIARLEDKADASLERINPLA